MTTSPVSVGAFTFDPTTNTVSGPAEYMRSAEYRHCIASITSGTNHVFATGAAGASPSVEVALLVAIQTDYAGWAGMRDFNARRGL